MTTTRKEALITELVERLLDGNAFTRSEYFKRVKEHDNPKYLYTELQQKNKNEIVNILLELLNN